MYWGKERFLVSAFYIIIINDPMTMSQMLKLTALICTALAAPGNGVASVNCEAWTSVEVPVIAAPSAATVDISEATGRTTVDVGEICRSWVEVASVVLSTMVGTLVAGRAALSLETGRAVLTLVATKAALLLDTIGTGSIKTVDTAVAVTVIEAVVSPMMMTDAGGVDAGIGEIVMKIVVVDVEERMVVASVLGPALIGVLNEVAAELASIAVIVFWIERVL